MPGYVKTGTGATAGRVCLNSSGQAIRCDGCGCSCPHCNAGTVSATATLSASGITIPTICIITPADLAHCPSSVNISLQCVGLVINASGVTLTAGGGFPVNCCSFTGGNSSGTIYDGCSGSGTFENGCAWFLDFSSYPGFIKLYCKVGNFGPLICCFVGTIAIPSGTDCSATLTFSNDLTSTGAYYNDPQLGCLVPMGTGGTVVITFP